MLVAQNRQYVPKADQDRVQKHRELVKKQMGSLNPNVEVPFPKTIMMKKAAIDLVEFDHARELARACGEEVHNLSQPADPLNL